MSEQIHIITQEGDRLELDESNSINLPLDTVRIKEIHVPEGYRRVRLVKCDGVEVYLPPSLSQLFTTTSDIKELTLPQSIESARMASTTKVTNLEDFKDNTDVEIQFRPLSGSRRALDEMSIVDVTVCYHCDWGEGSMIKDNHTHICGQKYLVL